MCMMLSRYSIHMKKVSFGLYWLAGYTVEPPIKDPPNKGHKKPPNKGHALFQVPNVHSPIVLIRFLTSERGQPPFKGQKWLVLKCPLFRGFTVAHTYEGTKDTNKLGEATIGEMANCYCIQSGCGQPCPCSCIAVLLKCA